MSVLLSDEEVIDPNEEVITIQHEREIFERTNVQQNHLELKHNAISGEINQFGRNKERTDRLSSKLWNHFTIISKSLNIANCNYCGRRLSYKATISNLKQHLIRIHPKYIDKSIVQSYKIRHKSSQLKGRRPRLSELGGIDNFILNVVAEGESPVQIVGQEIEPSDIQEVDGHCNLYDEERIVQSESPVPKITSIEGAEESSIPQTKYFTSTPTPRLSKLSERIEKTKSNRIIDLQIECLELKKYTMQMESLLLERQLNLPRSIYTENLRGCDNVTRGTQTDVGGNNTKVFYITNQNGKEGIKHLFHFPSISE